VTPAPAVDARAPWWRDAVIYQIYPRSFSDSDGDGYGDLTGVRARLPYLAALGVDAIWLSPFYPSPQADGGYDVADYCDVDPLFGTLAHADALIADAHAAGLRVVVDIVPNHTSDQHAWFQAALAAAPGSRERARYIFRDGAGVDGSEPPNDWVSVFGGPAWHRAPDGQWYLHLFAPEQPDLDWSNREVRDEFLEVLAVLARPRGRRLPHRRRPRPRQGPRPAGPRRRSREHPRADEADRPPALGPRRGAGDLRRVAGGARLLRRRADARRRGVGGDARAPRAVRLARSSAHRVQLRLREITVECRAAARGDRHQPRGERRGRAPTTWVLSNHDVARHVTRFGRPQRGGTFDRNAATEPVDLELGTRRARAAALLMLALPGGAYVYQGEELGLEEVEDIPDDLLQDPVWIRSGHTQRGRDGCRVPLPWSATPRRSASAPRDPPRGFPQPARWKTLTAERQAQDPGSMLELYRSALRLRHASAALGDGELRWLATRDGVLGSRASRASPAGSTSHRIPCRCRTTPRCCSRAARWKAARCRPTPPCGSPTVDGGACRGRCRG
jgi:alpha-glucosidase